MVPKFEVAAELLLRTTNLKKAKLLLRTTNLKKGKTFITHHELKKKAKLLLRTPPRFKFSNTKQFSSQKRTSNFSLGEVFGGGCPSGYMYEFMFEFKNYVIKILP